MTMVLMTRAGKSTYVYESLSLTWQRCAALLPHAAHGHPCHAEVLAHCCMQTEMLDLLSVDPQELVAAVGSSAGGGRVSPGRGWEETLSVKPQADFREEWPWEEQWVQAGRSNVEAKVTGSFDIEITVRPSESGNVNRGSLRTRQ